VPARAAAGQRALPARIEEGLPLQLPAPAPFAGRIRPEEAVPCADAFDSPDWRFSVDWEGVRALLIVAHDGAVRLQAPNGSDLTGRFPELGEAGGFITRRPVLLDGVIAMLDNTGRPDLAGLGMRLLGPPLGRPHPPAVFLATDVLHAGRSSTLGTPLDGRLEALGRLLESGSTVQVPDNVARRGRALAEAASARGLSRMLARRGKAPYRPGVASPDRLCIPLLPRATCVVAGVQATRHSSAGRLVLGEYAAGRFVFAGRVEGPRDRRLDVWLRTQVNRLRASQSAFDADDQLPGTVWLRIALCATVSYTSRDTDGLLREASLIALRDDVDPAWCVRRDAVPPPDDVRAAAFVPTVLMPLPLDDTLLLPRQRS
jgi:bifunctional non-homologous end joining protein LigD